MKTFQSLAILSCLLFLNACEKKVETAPTPSYEVGKDEIILTNSSPFMKHLEIIKVSSASASTGALRGVGQMIALANSSGALSDSRLAWLELDPELTKSVGLNLQSYEKSSIGTAFGVTSVESEYENKIHAGQAVEVSRYGMQKDGTSGTIVKVQASKVNLGRSYVIFEMQKGQDWYPGTNCEVKFPLLKTTMVEVPTTAILHEGLREYAFKQTTPLHFKLVSISIVDETPDKALIIGLNPQDSVIGSGAILLKPELHNFIQAQKENGHVLQ